MPFKVKIDRSACIGSASCVAIAPDAFELDGEGKSTVKKNDGSTSTDFVSFEDINDEAKNIMNAAKACPVSAIVVIEVDQSGKEVRQVWPEA